MSIKKKTKVPEEVEPDSWTPDDWFADPEPSKDEVKLISGLVNALVFFVSLSKSAGKYDNDFPGLPMIRTEAQAAKDKAVEIMKELSKRWDEKGMTRIDTLDR